MTFYVIFVRVIIVLKDETVNNQMFSISLKGHQDVLIDLKLET